MPAGLGWTSWPWPHSSFAAPAGAAEGTGRDGDVGTLGPGLSTAHRPVHRASSLRRAPEVCSSAASFRLGPGQLGSHQRGGEPQSEWRGCPAITSATSCDKHQITAEHTHPRQLPRAPRHTAPGQVGGRSTRRTTRQPQQSPVAKFELSPALPGWRDLPGEMGECPCHLML